MEEIVQSKCGICVTHTLHDAYSFIKSLQHRGREACGIFAFGKNKIDLIKWKGSVTRVDLADLHKIFPASMYHTYGAHVRYATRGKEGDVLNDAHPHFVGGKIENKGDHMIVRNCDAIIIHNGQVNFKDKSKCDTELLLDYYLTYGEKKLLQDIKGSYSLAIADKRKDEVIVMRDRFGIKPACLGFKDGKYCVASESVSLFENGATLIEDLDSGALYYLTGNGIVKKSLVTNSSQKNCFFEWNYLSNEKSIIDGVSVSKIRQELGKELAKEFSPSDTDIITFLPRCPEPAARSYAKAIKQENKFRSVFYKLRGERAFQGTSKEERSSSIKTNLYLLPEFQESLKDKTVVLIDDSTIRGNNSKHAIALLKKADVKKVYLLNYTPKIGIVGDDGTPRGCLWGVDMPPEDDFIVRSKDNVNREDKDISREIGAEVFFLSVNGMFRAFERCGIQKENLCTFCIGGSSPFT